MTNRVYIIDRLNEAMSILLLNIPESSKLDENQTKIWKIYKDIRDAKENLAYTILNDGEENHE